MSKPLRKRLTGFPRPDNLLFQSQLGAQSASRLETHAGQVSYTLTEITKSVQKMQLNMPKFLGYPWEGDAPSSHVYLDDVLGRCHILPAVLCRNFSTFHDTLKLMFSEHPGFRKIVKGEYEIFDGSDGRMVFPGTAIKSFRHSLSSPRIAQAIIRPGSNLSMSILNVRTLKAPNDHLVSSVNEVEACPKCGFQTTGRQFRKW